MISNKNFILFSQKRPANPIEDDQLPIFDLKVSSINYLSKENRISQGYQITFSAPKGTYISYKSNFRFIEIFFN